MSRIEQLQQLHEADPEDSFIHYALAQEYTKLHQYYRARDTYIALKHRDPEYLGLYFHLGAVLQELDENEAALACYDEGMLVAKRQADIHALAELKTAKTNLEMELL